MRIWLSGRRNLRGLTNRYLNRFSQVCVAILCRWPSPLVAVEIE
jgi:hypothetical protein